MFTIVRISMFTIVAMLMFTIVIMFMFTRLGMVHFREPEIDCNWDKSSVPPRLRDCCLLGLTRFSSNTPIPEVFWSADRKCI